MCAGIGSDVAVARAGACALSHFNRRDLRISPTPLHFVALCSCAFSVGLDLRAGGIEESKELAKLAPIREYN